ncbi:cadmium, cobalt and zinc H(+)-K(+) antiporter [Lentilactobacillus senioris DSM 24302 = JCM 17472]|uniref:Cadmium, cobalt and zinc H(+)-K(+) antiporter n=1 Tax=Lentilactobacillus senioris DSM 24302 = JCM 17472 TaxID=1423802 RepID=A0A0R2CNU5_9LACO|nr:cation diffusion facilitator family transporter [Lentilactobacillus senioris]KRM93175.1 cadmium, cobalt and zinc H(+)-K(+) antiporter [Lentilactobacillus senioris DSM 24302 = JCM 17472]
MTKHQHTDSDMSGRRFFWVTVLNVVITIAEFVGGAVAGSLSLLSDAFHNLGDSLSIVISYFAHRISRKPQTETNTYGYRRAQIITALLNALALILVCAILVIEAVRRISHPEPINGTLMLTVAVIGLAANVISALLLSSGSKNNLNMRATYLHIMSDALSSVAIIIGGILIQIFNWTWVDPAVTIAVAIYIMYESAPIIKETIKILMEGAPTNLDFDAVKNDLLALPDVKGVHHLHAWLIDENNIIVSVHVNLSDMKISKAEVIYDQITKILKTKYGVCHVTIQAEASRGVNQDIIYDQGKDIP